MRLLLRGAGRTMALNGRWETGPGDCGGEAEAMLVLSGRGRGSGQREKGGEGSGLVESRSKVKRCAVAKLCHAKPQTNWDRS